jgi:hypothetical protein
VETFIRRPYNALAIFGHLSAILETCDIPLVYHNGTTYGEGRLEGITTNGADHKHGARISVLQHQRSIGRTLARPTLQCAVMRGGFIRPTESTPNGAEPERHVDVLPIELLSLQPTTNLGNDLIRDQTGRRAPEREPSRQEPPSENIDNIWAVESPPPPMPGTSQPPDCFSEVVEELKKAAACEQKAREHRHKASALAITPITLILLTLSLFCSPVFAAPLP